VFTAGTIPVVASGKSRALTANIPKHLLDAHRYTSIHHFVANGVVNGAFEFVVEAIILSHLVTVYGMKVIGQSGVGVTPSRHSLRNCSAREQDSLSAKYQSFAAGLTDLAG
jgi:hypothetical protein